MIELNLEKIVMNCKYIVNELESLNTLNVSLRILYEEVSELLQYTTMVYNIRLDLNDNSKDYIIKKYNKIIFKCGQTHINNYVEGVDNNERSIQHI